MAKTYAPPPSGLPVAPAQSNYAPRTRNASSWEPPAQLGPAYYRTMNQYGLPPQTVLTHGQGPQLRAQTQQNGPDAFNAALAALMAGSQPSLAGLQLDANGMQRNLGFAYQSQGLKGGELQNNYDAQLADINSQLQGNAVDQGAALRLLPYYDQLSKLANDALASQMKGFGYDEYGARNNTAMQKAALLSSAVSRGAVGAPGTLQQRGGLEANLGAQVGNINVNRELAGNANQEKQQTLAEQRSQAQDRTKQLQIEADNLRMKPDFLKKTLENGLQQLGLSTAMTVGDLMDGLAKNNMQAMAIYHTAIQTAGQWSSIGGGMYGGG